MKKKTVKFLSIAGLLLAVVTAVGPCAITHKYGPYYGIVVDQETSEPIEGAAVLVSFDTRLMTPAGEVVQFGDALETTTNKQGRFYIESYRAWTYRLLNHWDTDCGIRVFKPGYGAYPDNPKIKQTFLPYYSIPSNQYSTIALPKIDTYDERRRNLSYILQPSIPDIKQMKTLELYRLERKLIHID